MGARKGSGKIDLAGFVLKRIDLACFVLERLDLAVFSGATKIDLADFFAKEIVL